MAGMFFKDFKNKKASEKTIEIFVALFLILAVAMVLLKMFSGQVADKSNELNRMDKIQASTAKCNDLCTKAKSNDCRVEDQIAFCTAKYKFDLNGDHKIDQYDKGSVVLCEDNIYCPLETECDCGMNLNMKNCLELTKNYYNENGIPVSTIQDIYKYTSGACDVTKLSPRSWPKLYNLASYK